ncbi:MAG: efflux RND transporter permease subunit [Pirellulaceae bacterium]
MLCPCRGSALTPLGSPTSSSILSSFVVSMTVTPVLSYYLLPNSAATHRKGDSHLLKGLKAIVSPLIRLSMAMLALLILGLWIAVGIAACKCRSWVATFSHHLDEGSVQVNVTLPPRSSLSASNQISQAIDSVFLATKRLTRILTVKSHFVRRTGRAEMDEHASPVNWRSIPSMNPESPSEREEVITRLRQEISSQAPGVDIEVEQPLGAP